MKKGGLQHALFEKFMMNSMIVITLILLVLGVILIKIMDNYVSLQQVQKLEQLEGAIATTNKQVANLNRIIAANWLQTGKNDTLKQADINNLAKLNDALLGSYLMDDSGRVLYASGPLESLVGQDFGTEEDFLASTSNDGGYTGSPYLSPYSGQVVFNKSLALPTKLHKYVIVSLVSLEKIVESINKDASAKYLVMDKTGQVITFGTSPETNRSQMKLLEALPVFQHTVPQSGKSYWYKDPQTSQLVIGTVKEIEAADYSIIVQEPLLQTFKPAVQLIFFLLLIAFFAIMVASALSERVAENFWSALDDLVVGATQIAAGNYQALALKHPAYDEIDLVQKAFMNMAKNIEDRQQELQQINQQVQAANEELIRAFTIISEKEAENKAHQVGLISVLVDLIELNDTYTGGHSRQVTYWALLLAKGMIKRGYKVSMEEIEIAAILHDIGKIGVPTHILKKPGRLSDEEFEIIKLHPVTGAQAIEKVRKLKNVQGIVRHHHERFDGAGYPDQLEAESIPLGARIVGIADSFHAMISDRTYRKALEPKEALEELRRNAGTQFDPELVEIFLEEYAKSA